MTRWQPPETRAGTRPQPSPQRPGRFPTGPTAPRQAYRRAAGLGLGLAFGFIYTLVSQLINPLALPGIPLYQPPLGPPGNILLGTLGGGLLGLLCTWPDSGARGILQGAGAAAATVIGYSVLHIGVGAAATLVAILLAVPLAWLTVPGIAGLRWLTDRQVEAWREGTPPLRRLALPVALMVLLGALAAFELHGAVARTELRRMDALVQAGLRAADTSALPAPLQQPRVGPFPTGARTRYALEWVDTDLDRFAELRPASSYTQHAAVIARFVDGYTLVCLYPTPKSEPNCGAYLPE